MAHPSQALSELLLSRLPQPENLAAYQEEVKALFAENEKRLRQNKWTVVRVWVFVIAFSIPCLYMAGAYYGTSAGNWFLGGTFFWVLFGSIEIAKYGQNQARVELLKELKQVQLQILEVRAALPKTDTVDLR